MAILSQKLTYRVTIDDQVFRVSPDIQINQSLDQLCTVASFNLASRPNSLPDDDTPVLIEWVDVGAGRAYPIFGGKVNIRSRDAQPWKYQVTAVDQLENFRRMRQTGDMNLTGMTDRQAWMAIADACEIDYDPDDIGGTTYVLGAHVPVKWHKDNQTSGGQIIAELDEVFGFKTMTVGNNRVIRIHLDQTPEDTTGLYRSYTKGVNLDFLSDTRVTGDRDQIQNAWKVTGPKIEISKSCTSQVWAAAESGSGYLASKKVRIGQQDYGSDFIQDEDLAEYIVRRLMRQTNRLSDRFSVRVLTDVNLHVGSKVRVVDTTKGLGASTGKLCMVASMVVNGFTTDLELYPGPGGNEGTVTHGTEKICNKTSSDTSTTDGFDAPDFGYPPLIDGIDDDFDGADGVDETSGETPPPMPLESCTTSTTFTSDCAGSETDFCDEGTSSTTDISGTSPADFCVTYLGPERLQTHYFAAGGPGFSTECRINVPWRLASSASSLYFHVTESGAIDYVQTSTSDTTGVLYSNTYNDPDNQDADSDTVFGVPVALTVSGIVEFFVPGSTLRINMPRIVGGIESGVGPSITIYADPGLTFTPVGGDQQTIGVEISTDFQSPLWIGSALPNMSAGGLNRNNGGYVISSPAALGVPVAFSVTFDESRKEGWGWTLAETDLGSGYIDHLDYLNPATPFPGEPSSPTATCAEDHDGHKLCISMSPGGVGTKAEPGVRLYGLVVGHTTCAVNPEYTP